MAKVSWILGTWLLLVRDSTVVALQENLPTCIEEEGTTSSPVCKPEEGTTNSHRLLSLRNGADHVCSLYLAKSDVYHLGLFAGVDMMPGDMVGQPELVIPIVDANTNEKPNWFPYTWNSDVIETLGLSESLYDTKAMIPGVGTHVACHEGWANANLVQSTLQQDTSITSPGSRTYRHNMTMLTTQHIRAGEEIFVSCQSHSGVSRGKPPAPKTQAWLNQRAICVDGLRPGLSTHAGGRGAFATRFFSEGSVVTYSPVLHFDKRDLDMVQQKLGSYWEEHEEEIIYNRTNMTGRQLLLNYCFGHKHSDILLFPFGPMVNHINHGDRPNVKIQWSKRFHNRKYLDMEFDELVVQKRGMAIEYVALRDIPTGEEIFLDYGIEWEQAWQKHSQEWKIPANKVAVSASEFNEKHGQEPIRTQQEESDHPRYPKNLMTACYYAPRRLDTDPIETEWSHHNDACLRPCRVVARDDENNVYTAVMEEMPHFRRPSGCIMGSLHTVQGIPRDRILLLDRPYTSDMHLKGAFRHALGVPEGFYPEPWLRVPEGRAETFVKRLDLKPYELSQVRWADTNKPVANYSYEMGLEPLLRETLLEYCDKMGIMEAFQHMLIDGNPLHPGTSKSRVFGGHNWFIQRPKKYWHSNMHWISPDDEPSHDDYLRALSQGGFDRVLDAIGQYFGFKGLVVYHVTFIGVSHCAQGYMHHDFTGVHGKAFNVIVPLRLAKDTGPELDLQQDLNTDLVGGYKYRYDVASMVGDDAKHATSAIDYRDQHDMRVAATIYIADVNVHNLGSILNEYTQKYPPDDPNHLFNRRARHWKATDPSKKLPLPLERNDAEPKPEPGSVMPITWKGQATVPNLFQVGLPSKLKTVLRSYIEHMGMEGLFQEVLVDGNPYMPQIVESLTFDGYYWNVLRPLTKMDLHYLSPADDDAFHDFLCMLSEGGFDKVLGGIGEFFGMNQLAIFQVAILGISYYYPKKDARWTISNTGKGAYEVVVPIALVDGAAPEHFFWQRETRKEQHHTFAYDVAPIVGNGVEQAVAPHSYQVQGKMRITASILVGDVADNVVLSEFVPYPTPDLLADASTHWSRSDDTVKLPVYEPFDAVEGETVTTTQ